MIKRFKHFESNNIDNVSDIINIAKDEGLTVKMVKRVNSSQLFSIDIYNNIDMECQGFIDIIKNMTDRLIQLGIADSIMFLDDKDSNKFVKTITLEKSNYLDDHMHNLLHFNVNNAKIFLLKCSIWTK